MKKQFKLFSPNKSVSELREKLKEVIKIPTVVSHGSRSENCLKAVEEVKKLQGIIINDPDYIINASDKFKCKSILKRINLPTTSFQKISDAVHIRFPVVAKLRRGSGGLGMQLLENIDEYNTWKNSIQNKDDYFIEEMFNPRKQLKNHILTTREFRVHCFPMVLDTGFFIVKKLIKNINDDVKFGKNISSNDVYFTTDLGDLDKDTLNKMKQICVDTINSVRLDYGAIDIQYNNEKGFNILEINTAPAIGDLGNTLQAYYEFILNIYKLKNNRYDVRY